MSDNAFRIVVVVMLALLLIALVADVVISLRQAGHDGIRGRFHQGGAGFGPGRGGQFQQAPGNQGPPGRGGGDGPGSQQGPGDFGPGRGQGMLLDLAFQAV